MKSCPVADCGRKFQNEETMLQHVRRRHPTQYDSIRNQITKSIIQTEHAQQNQLKKLPKLAKIMSKQKQKRLQSGSNADPMITTGSYQLHRRSSSKTNKSLKQKNNVSSIIQQSRQQVMTASSNTSTNNKPILAKRPSLNKKNSAGNLTQEKLPGINEHKIKRPIKLAARGSLGGTEEKDDIKNFNSTKYVTKTDEGDKNTQEQNFYTTAPNFHKINQKITEQKIVKQKKLTMAIGSSKKGLGRSKSKGRDKSKQQKPLSKQKKILSVKQPIGSAVEDRAISAKLIQQKQYQIQSETKNKNFYRPTRKIVSKPSTQTKQKTPLSIKQANNKQKLQIQQKLPQRSKATSVVNKISKQSYKGPINFDQKVVVIKQWPLNDFQCPQNSTLQCLYINSCSISSVQLNNIESLITLSITHNNLSDTSFLKYSKNYNIKSLHLDYNNLVDLYLPPKVKVVTASFNKLKSQYIEELCATVRRAPDLQQIDLSFNNVRKAPNYKMKMLSVGNKIRKIDGLNVTKIDRDMVKQYMQLYADQIGLIPLCSNQQYSPSSTDYLKQRPSTAASYPLVEQFNIKNINFSSSKTYEQLERQCKKFQKQISQTKTQLKLILQQNQIISQELQELQTTQQQTNQQQNNIHLYQKLQKQCQCLQVLNFLRYADEEQLTAMIEKKKLEIESVN